MNNDQINRSLAHDLILVPVSHDGHSKVYQTNLWDTMRRITEPPVLIDLLIGVKN
jgi:hypothetical protein